VRVLRVHGGVHGAVHRGRARAVRRAVDLRPVRGRGRRGARPRFPAHLARHACVCRRGSAPPSPAGSADDLIEALRMLLRRRLGSPPRRKVRSTPSSPAIGSLAAVAAGSSLGRAESCFFALVDVEFSTTIFRFSLFLAALLLSLGCESNKICVHTYMSEKTTVFEKRKNSTFLPSVCLGTVVNVAYPLSAICTHVSPDLIGVFKLSAPMLCAQTSLFCSDARYSC
jgi:hypothetical protein